MQESGSPENLDVTREGKLSSDGHIVLAPDSILLDRYKVLGLLGKGGMGSVFHVRHIHLKSEFALKVLNRQADDTSWRRFENEAKAANRLDHPNLIKVHDSGLLPDGEPFFIMEMVKGETLSEIINKQGRLPLASVLKIFIQVGFALSYAHECGVIHRDLKPSNIMIVKEQEGSLITSVKVVDLGIAKLTGIDEFNQQTLTRTGEIFGSPLYMSPEQCIGSTVDHRTDLYSLGCSMYEALTGAPPLIGENALSTMMKHQMKKPLLLKEASMGLSFPAELEILITKLLEKDPEKRYSNAQLLTHDLVLIEQTLGERGNSEQNTSFSAAAVAPIAQSKTFLRANLVVVALVIVAYILGFATSKISQPPVEVPEEIVNQKESSYMSSVFVSPKPSSHEIAPVTQRNIVPISEMSADGKFRIFNFPTVKSVGIFHVGREKPVVARGVQRAPIGEIVRFTPDGEYLRSADLLSRFAPDDLSVLILEDQMQESAAVMAAIPRLKRLSVLKLSMDIGDEAIPYIDKLPNLESLTVSHTKIKGSAMATLKRLPYLKQLACAQISDVSPVLQKLSPAHLTSLKVDDTHLTREDLRTIAKAKNLTLLSIGGNKSVNDDSLVELKPLTNLNHLYAIGCSISEKSLSTLQTFKKLMSLHISYLTQKQLETIQAGLPNTRVSKEGGGDLLLGER